MQCPRCHHENPRGMKFCGECASPLAATCPSCGAANPPENKFCGQCAAPLRPTPAAQTVCHLLTSFFSHVKDYLGSILCEDSALLFIKKRYSLFKSWFSSNNSIASLSL